MANLTVAMSARELAFKSIVLQGQVTPTVGRAVGFGRQLGCDRALFTSVDRSPIALYVLIGALGPFEVSKSVPTAITVRALQTAHTKVGQ